MLKRGFPTHLRGLEGLGKGGQTWRGDAECEDGGFLEESSTEGKQPRIIGILLEGKLLLER